jgi:hypothetical protein
MMLALQKKSPGQRPGRSFLQKEVYQTHNPLVKTKISDGPQGSVEKSGNRRRKIPKRANTEREGIYDGAFTARRGYRAGVSPGIRNTLLFRRK